MDCCWSIRKSMDAREQFPHRGLPDNPVGTTSEILSGFRNLQVKSEFERQSFDSAIEYRRVIAQGLVNDTELVLDHPGAYYDLRVYNDGAIEWYPYMFGKSLEHDLTHGFVKKSDVDKLIHAIRAGTTDSLDAIPISTTSVRKLEGVPCALSHLATGSGAHVARLPFFYPVDSVGGAFEMMEVYSHAILRDTAFSTYSRSPVVQSICDELNQYSDKTTAPVDASGNITPQTLFRGAGPEETVGPLVSQFLLYDFMYGNLPIQQKYAIEYDAPHSVTDQGWLEIQNGSKGFERSTQPTNFKYVGDCRGLGSKVHMDPLFQFYYNAALVAFGNGIGPSAWSHPRTTAWTDGANPYVLATVSHVALGALRHAWNAKWNSTMKIRPEVYAQRLHHGLRSGPDFRSNVPGLEGLIKSCLNGKDAATHSILKRVAEANGNGSLYLKLQYAEGSPTHPSLPAGHATVAGACTTVLKALLQTHDDNNQKIKWQAGSRKVVEAAIEGDRLVEDNFHSLINHYC